MCTPYHIDSLANVTIYYLLTSFIDSLMVAENQLHITHLLGSMQKWYWHWHSECRQPHIRVLQHHVYR